MLNKARIKAIENELKARLKPQAVSFIRRDNGKVVLLPPGLDGSAVLLNLVVTDEGAEVDFDIEAIKREYPGYEPIDFTEEYHAIVKNLDEAFR